MISKKRSDFFYTLTDDERKALASIERVEQELALKTISPS